MSQKLVSFLFILGVFISVDVLYGQSVIYSFDDCSLSEQNNTLPSGVILGDPECTCGLQGNSFYLDGNDTLVFPPEFSDLFVGESFTLDFYFTIEPQAGEMDIFSSSSSCLKNDSTMYFKYLGSTEELFFLLSSNINNILLARTKIDPGICWHRFTLVKSKTEYFYYLNNKLITRFVSRENIPLSRTQPFALGINRCSALGATPFRGQFDDIVFLRQALSPVEITASYKFPDQIITKDTTIFTGDAVMLSIGESCSGSVSWTPGANLDISDPFMPIASPEETTVYQSRIQYRHCNISDTVKIYVVDEESIDCADILLPKAFTPNNDGLNDVFGVSNLFILEGFEFLEIYDRSGTKVWVGNDASMTWDGRFRGQPLTSGVYYYKVKYRCGGEEYFKVDTFTLLR